MSLIYTFVMLEQFLGPKQAQLLCSDPPPSPPPRPYRYGAAIKHKLPNLLHSSFAHYFDMKPAVCALLWYSNTTANKTC